MYQTHIRLLLRCLSVASGALLLWAVLGCAGDPPLAPAASSSSAVAPSTPSQTTSSSHGHAQAGPQVMVGAHVYLLAAATTGYGAPSIPLLNPAVPGVYTDALGAFVLTDAQGAFDLAANYACTPGQFVYVLASGGSAGGESTPNPASAMLTILGTCPAEGNFDQAQPFIDINQVSTVATAFALSGFLTDATHLAAAATPGSQIGLANAFAGVRNLIDPSTGVANPETPNSSGIVPQAEINTLANAIVPCIAGNAACTTLFALTHDLAGNPPADTVSALLNIAHNPGANAPALFALAANGPFSPALSTAPADWTLSVTYFAPNLAGPYFPAVDAAGNLWVPGFANNTVTEFDPTGVLLSGNSGFSGGGLAQPFAVAFDTSGNAWISNFGGSATPSVSVFAPNGSAIADSGYPCGTSCTFLAVDTNQNVWISGSPQVTTVKSSGLALSAFSTNGFSAGVAIDSQGHGWTIASGRNLARLTLPAAVTQFSESVSAATAHDLNALAIDAADNIWFTSTANSALGKYANAGTAISPVGGYTGGGLHAPAGIAIDGSNRVWVANRDGNSLSAFSSAGVPLSPTGYTGAGISDPRGLAIDPSGNVWITNFTGSSVTEFIGVATPTATPVTPLNHGQRP